MTKPPLLCTAWAVQFQVVLRSISVYRDMEYDGKNAIIKFTLKEGDFVFKNKRALPYITDYTIEVV